MHAENMAGIASNCGKHCCYQTYFPANDADDGCAAQVDGNLIKWQKWHIRHSFNYREGLVLHDVGCATLAFRTPEALDEPYLPFLAQQPLPPVPGGSLPHASGPLHRLVWQCASAVSGMLAACRSLASSRHPACPRDG